jgi:hypothetical protein
MAGEIKSPSINRRRGIRPLMSSFQDILKVAAALVMALIAPV